jgi:hypothetical protein
MGISISRISPAPFDCNSMEFSEGIVNANNFGNVYILKYTPRPTMPRPTLNDDIHAEAHDTVMNHARLPSKAFGLCDVFPYIVVCDIKGGSTETFIHGRELHLVLGNDDPNSTILDKRDLCNEAASYEKVFFIGKYMRLPPLLPRRKNTVRIRP